MLSEKETRPTQSHLHPPYLQHPRVHASASEVLTGGAATAGTSGRERGQDESGEGRVKVEREGGGNKMIRSAWDEVGRGQRTSTGNECSPQLPGRRLNSQHRPKDRGNITKQLLGTPGHISENDRLQTMNDARDAALLGRDSPWISHPQHPVLVAKRMRRGIEKKAKQDGPTSEERRDACRLESLRTQKRRYVERMRLHEVCNGPEPTDFENQRKTLTAQFSRYAFSDVPRP